MKDITLNLKIPEELYWQTHRLAQETSRPVEQVMLEHLKTLFSSYSFTLTHPPTFILCAPRSGSTWLRLLLNDHPEIGAGTESYVFSDWAGVDSLIAAYQGKRGSVMGLHSYLSEDHFYHHLRHFIDNVFGDFLAHEHKEFLVEKSVRHAFFLPTIARLYPEARLIHLVRDGRDVALSLRDAAHSWNPHWPKTIEGCATLWKTYNEEILSHLNLFPAESVLRLRYEELLADTSSTIARVLAFIDVTQTHHDLIERLVANHQFAVYKKEKDWFGGHFFRQGTAGQWQHEFTPEETAAFKAAAGELLLHLGYETNQDWQPATTPP
jgi:hypothetical protein